MVPREILSGTYPFYMLHIYKQPVEYISTRASQQAGEDFFSYHAALKASFIPIPEIKLRSNKKASAKDMKLNPFSVLINRIVILHLADHVQMNIFPYYCRCGTIVRTRRTKKNEKRYKKLKKYNQKHLFPAPET